MIIYQAKCYNIITDYYQFHPITNSDDIIAITAPSM